MPTRPNISRLSDDQLLASAIDLARHERSLNLKIIEHLREIGRRGLHLRHGYGSLFGYAVKELEFSEGSAYQRLQALKLSDEFPEVKQDMVEGGLSLTSVGYLQSAFDRHQRRWRQRARQQRRGGTGGDLTGGGVPPDGSMGAEDGASGGDGTLMDGATGQPPGAPQADSSGAWSAAGPGAAPLSAAAKRELIKRARGKSTRQVRELIAELDPELVRPRDRLRALGRDRWEIKAVIDGECRRSLEQLLHWLSHVNPTMDYGELLQRVVADAVAKHDPARRRARVAQPASTAPKVVASGGSPVGERGSRGAATAKVGDGSRGGERRSRDAAITAASIGGGSRGGERRSHGAAAAAADVSAGSQANRHRRGEAETDSAAVAVPLHSRLERSDGASAHQTVRHRNTQRPKNVASAKYATAQRPALESRLVGVARVRSRRKQPGDVSPDSASANRSTSAASERETQAAEVVPAAVPGRRHSGSDQSGTTDMRQPARNEGSRQRGAPDCRDFAFAQEEREQVDSAERSAADGRDANSDQEHGHRRRRAVGGGSTACAQKHRGVVASEGRGAGGRRPRATITRAIPAAVRQHIWLRDGGRCTYRDPDSGRCCGAQHLLQIDHIQPFAIGGANSERNLRLLCAAHNRARGRKQAAASGQPVLRDES